ncbi:peptidoglycan/LPS O-acetylase OafA/YrhL [Paraburkholderia sp. CI2]|uniref:acyltransferase family protein n=1 Tax=Paraburkholderia sp. CI2 TaxID=2723093 RepID=UPI00161FCD80|nr:acyltransferase family protein [Paraburkholderia sp. CI2]MBB5467984.1 peptidoglycan/LPS O-acetylase OafA/YrhL [Paraburkholderia sp. CI2]
MNPRHNATTAPQLTRPAHAAYIDGLRAVAVLSVIVYHLYAQWLPGGLAGVDIFFVVSGFVVSASVGNLESMQFSRFVFYFYSRRVQRIVPALVVCLLVTGLFSALFIPNAWLSDTNKYTGFFAFFGLSNVVLAFIGDDYFSPRAEFNPYLHTWSLGVEEQFYLIFPLLFFMWVSKRPRKTLCVVLFAGGLALSVLSAWWLSRRNEGLNFYLIPGRFWELASGILLYQFLALAKRPLGVIDRNGTLGSMALLVGSLVLLAAGFKVLRPEQLPFPGALLPVAGTLGVLYALHGRAPRDWLHRLLISPAVTFVGKISYSLYLWHWSVIVLLRWTTGIDAPVWRVLAAVLSFALATASWYYVENPVRRSAVLKGMRRPALVGAGLATLTCGALLWVGIQAAQLKLNLSLSVVSQRADDWYPSRPLEPSNDGCLDTWNRTKLNGGPVWTYSRAGCSLPATYRGRLYVIGDSHAMAYNRMLREFARDTGVKVFAYNNGGCPFMAFLPRKHDEVASCAPGTDAAIAQIEAQVRPGDVVFLPSLRLPRFSDEWARFDDSSAWGYMFGPEAVQSRVDGVREAIPILQKLAAKGAKVILEGPTPEFRSQPFRCSDWFNRDNPICSGGDRIARADLEALRAPVLESYAHIVQAVPEVSVWDPLLPLCPDSVCSTHTADGRPLVFDGDHLSGYANRLLLPSFKQLVSKLMEAGSAS